MRPVKPAREAKVAADPLAVNEAGDPIQRIVPFARNAMAEPFTVCAHQVRITDVNSRRDLTAISRAATPTGILGINDHRVPAAARGLERCAQPGIAGAYDDNIGLFRQLRLVKFRTRRAIPPVRLSLVGGCKQPAIHVFVAVPNHPCDTR